MLNELLDRIGGARRLAIAAVGLGVAALILVASRVATAPNMVPAITNVPLQSASDLADRLDQAGIKYKLDQGGAEILVAETDLARARVALAKDGLPGGNRPGLELFDRPSWGWNDFTQRVNYRRALEGELERTIGHMRGVERAEVHLAISEQPAFRRADDRPATASVVIALKNGGAPAPEVVAGIAHLVSSSVDGLAADNVSIHDDAGRQWSEPNDGGTPAGLSSRQLRVQQDVEKYLEKKAEDIISQIVGAGNAKVQVAAAINFDKVERTTQEVNPDKQALASEQKAEITPGAQGGAASTNIANSYENSKSTETFSGAIGNLKRLTVAVLVNDRRLPSTGVKDTVPKFQPRTAAELARIELLVRSAVGVDSARGDVINVASQQFETPKPVFEPVPEPDLGQRVQEFQRPVLTGVGLLLAFVLALGAMRTLRTKGPLVAGAQPQLAIAGGAAAMPAMAPAQPPAQLRAPGPSRFEFPEADTELRDKVVATVSKDPDGAARLLKSWIKDEA
ncbi:MAG: flagellar M-ring protein FliF [Gemmatimonadetes bacterium]|nr:flagellar M-ring protein FliF [Gemmatimonadota bacterium]